MRNKLLLLLLLLLPAWVAWAQAPVWQNVSGLAGSATTVRGSALAANGDYYIVGSFLGSADFGNGKSLTSSDQTYSDGFLARISGTTNLCTWVVSMGGTAGADEVRGVAVSGNTVYITGYYSGSASFANTSNAGSQPLTAVVNPSTSTGSIDVFVAKYDENGNPLGSISGGGTGSDQGYSIAVNGTNIYITGFISTSTSTSTNVKFGTVTLGNSGSQDMFVARFTDNGTLAHGGALSGGGTGLDRGNAIGVGTNGIYVAGYLTGAVSTTISGSTFTGAGSNDIYVAKFTDSGSGLNNGGAVRSGGANSDQATALTVSGTSIYVGGLFNQNATPGTPATVSISGSSLTSDNRDLFLAKYTDSGSGLSNGYAIRDGGANPESVGDLAVSGSTVYVVGSYTTAAAIAGSNLTSNGDDAYVAKYTDTGATFSAIGAIDGGPSAGGAATTGASTVSVSGNQVVLGGFLGSPATFAPAATGTITVPANNSGFFARLAQAPVLTSISPNAGPVGTSVTLTGTNLTGATVVTFSGTSNNTVTSVIVNGTGTQTITVNVPAGATTGNVTVTTPVGTSNGVVFTVQQPTTVASIVPTGANPTNATSVTFTVTFAANVTGVTTANFATVNGGGVTGSSVTSVSGSGTTYSVTVNTGSGSGTVGLNMTNDTGVTPGISNDPFTGQTVTIDKTAPTATISSSTAASGSTSSAATFAYTVTFSESVTGFVAGDVAVSNGTLSGFSGSGSTYTFNVTPSGNGAVTVNIAANVAQDAAGNTNTAASQYSITYAAPNTTVASITRLNLSPTATPQVRYQVVFASNVTGLTVSNFSVTTTGSVSGTNVSSVAGSGTTYTVTVNTGTGDGTLRLNVANTTGTTPSITNVPYTLGETYTITKSFAAAPTLRIQAAGSASGNSDVTAFVDVVQVVQSGTSTVVANGLQNGSFETNNVSPSNFLYQSQGVVASPWSFGVQAGVSRNNSAFGSTAADGDAVALLQSSAGDNGSVTQNLAVPTGSYQVRFRTLQRNYTSLDQRLNVFVNDVFVGNIQPNNIPAYDTFTSAAFSVTAPALTATISSTAGTSGSTTATSPIPYTVTFSQSVTGFDASDVAVAGGTLSGFSGSGTTYTFNVTPSASGTVTVNVPANGAVDGNNTGNTAATQYSLTFQAPTIVVGPAVLPNGTQGTAYSQALSASGGTAPYSYVITAGALPAGLSLTNGTIAGTPTTNGTFTFTVTATDASAAPGPYSGARSYTFTINAQPVTAAPVVTTPANGSLTTTTTPAYQGTAPAGSIITVYVDGTSIGTTTAAASGSFSLVQPTALSQGSHTVYATAQTSGSAVSANSNTNTFSVDSVRPSVAISSSTAASGSSTSTSPFAYTVTFSEAVTGFVAGDVSVSNGTLSGFSGSGTTYTFNVTPTTAGTATTVNIAANVAQDGAGNGNTAATQYSLTFVAPTIVVAPASLPNGTQGTAYSQALSASGGSGTYTYAITAGALPAGLSLTNGTIAGTPTTNGSFTFTVTATDNSAAPGPYTGSRSYTLSIAAPAVTSVTWTGTISTDWFTAGNWSPNQVPTATLDATIPTAPSGSRFPALSAGTANVRNLTFNSGATLTQTGGTLNLAANLTNNGTFQPTGGTVVLGNTTLGNILGSSNTRFWNLTVNSSGARQSTSASTSVQRVLTLNGNFATNGNPFTLESNANGTAMVVNNGSNVVSGNVTVQRYISGDLNPNLGYRHFSSPISTGTVASLATSAFTPVVNPAYNTLAVPGQARPFPTVFGYDQSRIATATNSLPSFDKGWFSPSALSDALTVGQGYAVNLSGDQTITQTGAPNNGTIVLNVSRNAGPTAAESGLSLVGNPYPSPLDWSAVTEAARPGLDGVIYTFTSNNPADPYAGSYSFYNNGIGNMSPTLALGQGFFVRVTQGQTSATITLQNSQRPTAYTNTTYRRTAAETRPVVHLTLKGAGNTLNDDAFVYFENGASEVFDPQYDAVKIPNTNGLNLSTSVTGKQFSIDGRPELGAVQRVIPLAVGVPAPGSYALASAELLNLAATPVYLRDLQLGTLTDLRLTPNYQFTVTNASALITGRFELVLSPQQALATTPAALAQQVALYPNPAKKAAFVELPASLGRQAVTAALVDALGRQVRTLTLPAQGALAHQLDLSELATGVYALRLSTSAGVVVKKLVIE